MQNLKPPRVPLWKTLVVAATLLAAAIFILAINAYVGAALFLIGVFLQTYAGFSTAQPVAGETTGRMAALVFAWILLICMSIGMQSAVPQFTEVFKSFGADLPLPTIFAMQAYPCLLLLPLLVAPVWHFWPSKAARLRAAAISCWVGVGVNLLMFGTMYLPIFRLGGAV